MPFQHHQQHNVPSPTSPPTRHALSITNTLCPPNTSTNMPAITTCCPLHAYMPHCKPTLVMCPKLPSFISGPQVVLTPMFISDCFLCPTSVHQTKITNRLSVPAKMMELSSGWKLIVVSYVLVLVGMSIRCEELFPYIICTLNCHAYICQCFFFHFQSYLGFGIAMRDTSVCWTVVE